MNNLKQLTKKIQKAVPDIMKLEMGCILEDYDGNKYTLIMNEEERRKDIQFEGNLGIHFWYFQEEYNRIDDGFIDVKEILGRPIMLDDILIAIEKKQLKDKYGDRVFMTVNDNGMIYNWEEEPLFWRMGKPLHQQPQEVINFLNNLLCKDG